MTRPPHLCDHLLCSAEANLIVLFDVHVLVSTVCLCTCVCVLAGIFLVASACTYVCVETTFGLLFGLAGGALSQSLIYSGPFEIIELTHLSDGERRNAKRSPGEVPAAPTPNLSCLQIAQSLHHNRWDSCLSFLSHIHTYTHRHGGPYTQTLQVPITHIRRGTVIPDACHRQDRQTGTYCTHLQTHKQTQTHTHIFIPFFCHCLSFVHLRSLYSLSRSDFLVQGQYQLSTGNITPSYPQDDKRTNAVTLRTNGVGDILSAALFISRSSSFISELFCLMISDSKTELNLLAIKKIIYNSNPVRCDITQYLTDFISEQLLLNGKVLGVVKPTE